MNEIRPHPLVKDTGSHIGVVPALVERFRPKSVLDYGCNVGHWAREFSRWGVRWADIRGVDMDHLKPFFLGPESSFMTPSQFANETRSWDMVLCLEVLEHIPFMQADFVLEKLAACCQDTLVFSAAVPGQGGFDHVNERPHGYWISQLTQLGYHPDRELGERLCQDLSHWSVPKHGWVAPWYKNNLIIFRRSK